MDLSVAAITGLGVLLGVVIGRLLESRADSRKWWRDQRRAAYMELLTRQQEFVHITSISDLDRGETPEIRSAWLAVQQAASAVELAASDDASLAAKQLVVAARRNWVVLTALRSGGEVEGMTPQEGAQKASDNIIAARIAFVSAAKKDLKRLR